MNLAESQLFKLTITWPVAYDTQWAFKTLCMVFNFWYIAGNFFTASFTLIGYFKVTWQLAMKLFQAKISEWAHWKIYDVRRQQCSVTCKCSLMTIVTASLNFQLQNFQLYNKSLKDWYQGILVFPSASPRKHWDSWETKLTVSLGTSC